MRWIIDIFRILDRIEDRTTYIVMCFRRWGASKPLVYRRSTRQVSPFIAHTFPDKVGTMLVCSRVCYKEIAKLLFVYATSFPFGHFYLWNVVYGKTDWSSACVKNYNWHLTNTTQNKHLSFYHEFCSHAVLSNFGFSIDIIQIEWFVISTIMFSFPRFNFQGTLKSFNAVGVMVGAPIGGALYEVCFVRCSLIENGINDCKIFSAWTIIGTIQIIKRIQG